jgi:hypothetical protein
MQQLGKHIPAATNTHATIEETVYNQRIGTHNNKSIAGNGVFHSFRAKVIIKKNLMEFRDASLPGYGLGSGGIELREPPDVAVGRTIEMMTRK